MSGHGHVTPRPDGAKVRCGGPGICSACSRELALQRPGQEPCPHCPDGHQDPSRVPWSVRLGPVRDSDGQPMQLIVERTQGSHVAESDVEWLWQLIREHR